MKRRFVTVLYCLAITFCFGTTLNAADELEIHEWGTFTSFQDEQGRAFSRINTDDEPVPKFVHQLFYSGRYQPTDIQIPEAKAARYGHPDVTMRLETPVTYFHLPSSAREMTVDVSVTFKGGWLTEFFPKADTTVDQQSMTTFKDQELKDSTVSQLTWKGVRLGTSEAGPQTDDHVWLSPRCVQAAQLSVGGESERFLFYRGVGHRNAPLRVVRQAARDQFELHRQPDGIVGEESSSLTISKLWMVEVLHDGRTAFRRLPAITLPHASDEVLATTSTRFETSDFSIENAAELQKSLHNEIVAAGLFEDEATALIETWRLSYFRSPGVRLFFLVPQSWTDQLLPLSVSVPAKITRVMIGRVEIVTPEQRELVQKIANNPPVNLQPVVNAIGKLRQSASSIDREKYAGLASGRGDLRDLNVAVPESYQTYLALGRFRGSLILNEFQDRSQYHGYLDQFVYGIQMPGFAYERYQREKAERDELRARQQKNLRRQIDTAAARIPAQTPAKQGVVFLGDELIKGWPLARSFPEQTVIQYGFHTFYPSVFLPYLQQFLVAAEPRALVIHTGPSEVSSGMQPVDVVQELRELIEQIHEKLPQATILILAPTPTSRKDPGSPALREVRRLIQSLPLEKNRAIVVDVDEPLVDANGQLIKAVVDKTDGLNQVAYERWTRAISPYLTKN